MNRPSAVVAAVALMWVQVVSLAAVLALVASAAWRVHPGSEWLFLYVLLAGGLVVLQGFLAYRIAQGDNRSRLSGIAVTLMSGAVAALLVVPGNAVMPCLSYPAVSAIVVTLLVLPSSAEWFQSNQPQAQENLL